MNIVVFMVFLNIFIYLVKLCVRNLLSDRAALWYEVVIFFCCKNYVFPCDHVPGGEVVLMYVIKIFEQNKML